MATVNVIQKFYNVLLQRLASTIESARALNEDRPLFAAKDVHQELLMTRYALSTMIIVIDAVLSPHTTDEIVEMSTKALQK